MRVLIVEPQKMPHEAEINKDLHSMQRVVGGLIECVDLDNETTLVCNEEGKLQGLEGNRRVGRDIIAGTFFICGFNDDGEFVSLTDEQISKYKDRFYEPESFSYYYMQEPEFFEIFYAEDEDLEP